MLELRIENYVVKKEDGRADGWEYNFKEGEYFEANCESRDGRVFCTYRLDHTGESININTIINGIPVNTKDEKKVISQNNGDGSVRLVGGSVFNRYGYFRRRVYQDLLDQFNISSTKTFEDYGYETTFILESTPDKKMKLVFPKPTSIEFINTKCIKIANSLKSITPKPYETLVIRVKSSDYWFCDETYADTGRTIRRVYAKKNKNILSLLSE